MERILSSIFYTRYAVSEFTTCMYIIQSAPCNHRYRIIRLPLWSESITPPVDFWVGLTWTERPSRSAQRDLGWWGVLHARGWAWGNCWPCRQPCHIYCCDETWQGHPSCSIVHERLWARPCRYCSVRSYLEVWFIILGIRHTYINGPQYLLRSPWTVQQRSTPPSSFRGRGISLKLVKLPPPWLREPLLPPNPYGDISPPCRWSGVVSVPRSKTRHGLATTRWPLTMHGVLKFTCAIRVGSRITIPICLSKNFVIVQLGMCSANPRKSTRRNSYQRAFSTRKNFLP